MCYTQPPFAGFIPRVVHVSSAIIIMASKAFEKYVEQEVLINCVESRPVLWDKTLEIYKDKIAKTAAWREICGILKEDFEAMEQKERQEFGKYVIKKWNSTRDAWIRTLSEKKKLKKSGAAASNTKPYKYHNQMLFLKKVVTPGDTHENVPANDNITETVESNKDNEDEPDQITEQSGSDRQKERQNLAPPQRKAIKRNVNEVDAKMIEYMNDQLKKSKNEFEDPNLSFFKADAQQHHDKIFALIVDVSNNAGASSAADDDSTNTTRQRPFS
ncbi:hypothetical protein PYW07_006229 [Mythimna separata]|uniref:MADF domain-containing protein n=1 Tax=Mythimna separata TaxID=271217 RepID=A0AAD7YUI1_MYTSE|nr:hypothetical protein PYW07_006229 [Mythimna separata]